MAKEEPKKAEKLVKPVDADSRRNELLALRGRAEMLVLQGADALHMLHNGRYQASLKFKTPRAAALIAENTSKLELLKEELSKQAEAIKTALSTLVLENGICPCHTHLATLASEIEDHRKRLPKLLDIVSAWHKELNPS